MKLARKIFLRATRVGLVILDIPVMKSIFRKLDLMFVITDRARKARLASIRQCLPMTLLYDGGLEVQARHLLPEFKAGRPPFDELTRVRLVRILENGPLQEFQLDTVYLPSEDAFRFHGGKYMPRCDTDRWLLEDDYADAFARAVDRAIAERDSIKA